MILIYYIFQVIFNHQLDSVVNVFMIRTIEVYNNPKSHSCKHFLHCFTFFPGGKIISPQTVAWFSHSDHIRSVLYLSYENPGVLVPVPFKLKRKYYKAILAILSLLDSS